MNSRYWRWSLWVSGLAAMAGPALAQPRADTAELAPGAVAPAAADAGAARSALRQAVNTAFQQRDGAGGPQDRRLTAEQRQQLREQVRRAALVAPEAELPVRESHLSPH